MFFVWLFFVVGILATAAAATPSVIRLVCMIIVEIKSFDVEYKTAVELKNGRIALRKELAAQRNAEKAAKATVDAEKNVTGVVAPVEETAEIQK